MGRRENNKKVKKYQTSSEDEASEEEVEDQEQEDLQEADFYDQADQQIDGDSIILQKIENKIQSVEDQEKLSWAAIYQVKKQEAELNEEMQKQIDAIKEKYQIQRVPLMHKISEAVSGKKLDKSIYSENEFVKSINLNKTKPKALKDYWGKVFDACALIAHENDVDLLEKLTFFKVELLNALNRDIKLTFEFEENEYFGNKIEIEVTGSVQDGNFVKKVDFKAKQKKLDENSLFGLLTGSDSDDQQLLDTCHDLYRAYISSTYFYFYEPSDDLDQEGQEDKENEDQDSEDEDEDDEQQVKAVQKPKGSAITEKPECKQQ